MADDDPDQSRELPSLVLIQGLIENAVASQERRAASMDQRGGVLLGFGGLLVGLLLRDLSSLGVLGVFGGAVALLSAGLSACAIFPNTATGLNPEALLVGYAAEPESHTRFRALSTLTAVFEAEEQTIQWKARLLRIATVLLPAAGAFLLVGGILGV